MLITADGRMTGCISGGCLEKAVLDRARRIQAIGAAELVAFDSSPEEDVLFGFGLGCRGVVEVLIEPLNENSDQMAFLAECVKEREDGVIATVFEVEGRPGTKLGDRMMVRRSGEVSTNIADESLCALLAIDARRVMNGVSQTIVYELPHGSATVFVECIQPPLALVVFGAGHDAAPLARFAIELGWHVTMVDYRPGNLTRARSLGADAVIVARPGESVSEVGWNPCDAVVVMNHNYLDDLAVLETVLKSPPRYVGVLGPRARTERMLADLRKRHNLGPAADIGQLYAPAGLDIGADNPEEIALSIVAEIKAVWSDRSGESLREKSGPLHARTQDMHAPRKTVEVIEGCQVA